MRAAILLFAIICTATTVHAEGWRTLGRLDGLNPGAVMAGHDDLLVAQVFDKAKRRHGLWRLEGDRWTPMPQPSGSPYSKALYVRGPDEIYALGDKLTISRWDGRGWHTEHTLGRRIIRGRWRLFECGGQLHATVKRCAFVRQSDGRWRRLKTAPRECDAEPKLPSPADCWRHTHAQQSAVIWCKNGLNVWDTADSRWRVHPAPKETVGLGELYVRKVERWPAPNQHSAISVGGTVSVWETGAWTTSTVPKSVDRIVGRTRPYLVMGDEIWGRVR